MIEPERPASRRPVDVSFIVATWNCAATVRRTFDSVLAQTGIRAELIVQDGGSKDATVAICSEYADRLVQFHSESDDGVYDAWNKALVHARGEWVCFLGADDYLPDGTTLARLVAAAERRPPSARVVYGRVKYFDEHGAPVVEQGRPWPEAECDVRRFMSIPHVGTLHHHTLIRDSGGFDTSHRIAGDYAMLLPELLRNGAFFADDVVVAHAGWGGISTRPEYELQTHLEVGRIHRRNFGGRVPFYWYTRGARILIRKLIFKSFGIQGLRGYERAMRMVRPGERLS